MNLKGFFVSIFSRDLAFGLTRSSRFRTDIGIRLLIAAVLFSCLFLSSPAKAQSLDEALRQQAATELAKQARKDGDPFRGAVVFFQHYMACSKCHSVGQEIPSSLGPDLATLGKDVGDESLVESVLLPSKSIRKGFESVTIAMADGTSKVGLLVAQTENDLTIREIVRGGELATLKLSDIEEFKMNSQSIMPAGQMNQLTSRQQFLDLIRYLMEIRDGGAPRARALQPSPTLLTLTLPEYEQHLDHSGLIQSWDSDSLKRGEAIYRRVCMNCHGTKEQVGSLPTSLRFAEGKFKNGSDPHAMYQTLTRGFGLMTAQPWMVPTQKYDVIHYIRETFLRPHNSTQFVAVDPVYLARLPKGDSRGPVPSKIEPWSAKDYGPSLTHTYEVPGASLNIAYKGIAIRLDTGAGGVSRGRHWMIFDTDTLRVPAVWSAASPSASAENFIDWRGIQLNGEHQIHPTVVGKTAYANPTAPGWANPDSGDFQDLLRVEGRDGRRYGPLPRSWAKFRGLYHYEQRVVMTYSVGSTDILESPGLVIRDESPESPVFLRTFNIGRRDHDLEVQIANDVGPLSFGISPAIPSADLSLKDGQLRLKLSRGAEPLKFSVWLADQSIPAKPTEGEQRPSAHLAPVIADSALDLSALTKGGPARWSQKLETRMTIGSDNGPFVVDVLTAPEANPWLAQMRFTGLDFFPDGRIALCTWDGDVWLVEVSESHPGGLDQPGLRWQRIASGLYQPLGLKIVESKIHVICRDQLAVLHDLNGDGETDFYECLNNDHQVTEHFHEFAMGLQTDAAGNFYYAKSGRHALEAVVPHHGTLLRISKDGSRTDILATGFRAANGVCLNPDGSFVVTDQEGFWNPKNRINWVTLDPSGKPKFYGNMYGYHDVTDSSDSAMVPPLCWITNAFDRSPAELLWVTGDQWGPLKGSLLNLSYGYGKVFVVPHENVHGVMQGGMIELPIPPFPTGVMRGRFHPSDHQLYLCGMFAWAGNATQAGGVYRLRATGRAVRLPIGLDAKKSGLEITFSERLDSSSVDPSKLSIKTWSLKRTAKYGSDHYNETPLQIQSTNLSDDTKTVVVDIADIRPTDCMEIKYSFRSWDGELVEGTIHNTIHLLRE